MPSRVPQHAIIGNGVAGTSAAEVIRKADPNARVIIYAAERYPLYNRVALPPFLKQKVNEQKVIIHDVPWHEKLNIELGLENPVRRVCPDENAIELEDGEEVAYDQLLLATGSRAESHPAGTGGGIYNFQTLDDAREISERVSQSKSAISVGGSYISYELAEAFRARGLQVAWIMRGPYFLRRLLDPEGGALSDRIAESHGVTMIHNEEIKELKFKDGQVSGVVTTNDRTVAADLVGVGVGVSRYVDFLAGSGITTGRGIITDSKLRTNFPNVFAAGDAAEYFDRMLGHHNLMGTWDNAVSQGRLAGANMLGAEKEYEEVPSYSTTLFHSRILAFGATPENDPTIEALHQMEGENYRRLFFREERLVGGVMIGDRAGRPKLMEMIRSRTPIAVAEREQVLAIR